MTYNNPYAPIHIERSIDRTAMILESVVLCLYVTTSIAILAGFIAGFSAGCVYRSVQTADNSPALLWAVQYGGLSALAHGVAGIVGGMWITIGRRFRWATPIFAGSYPVFGLVVGTLIGMAQTIVPSHYLPEQFWEAPFASSLAGLVASILAARLILRCVAKVLQIQVATQIRLTYGLTGGILALLLALAMLVSLAPGVDFVLGTILRFVSIALILSLVALYVGYRRRTRPLQADLENDEPRDAPEPPTSLISQ